MGARASAGAAHDSSAYPRAHLPGGARSGVSRTSTPAAARPAADARRPRPTGGLPGPARAPRAAAATGARAVPRGSAVPDWATSPRRTTIDRRAARARSSSSDCSVSRDQSTSVCSSSSTASAAPPGRVARARPVVELALEPLHASQERRGSAAGGSGRGSWQRRGRVPPADARPSRPAPAARPASPSIRSPPSRRARPAEPSPLPGPRPWPSRASRSMMQAVCSSTPSTNVPIGQHRLHQASRRSPR